LAENLLHRIPSALYNNAMTADGFGFYTAHRFEHLNSAKVKVLSFRREPYLLSHSNLQVYTYISNNYINNTNEK